MEFHMESYHKATRCHLHRILLIMEHVCSMTYYYLEFFTLDGLQSECVHRIIFRTISVGPHCSCI
jgi:hypothetical protein